MKVLWVTLGVLAALGLLCCGGIVLFGRNAFNTVVATNKDAAAFAESSLRAVAENWDFKQLENRSTSTFKSGLAKTSFAAFKTKLGKFVKVQEWRATGFRVNSDASRGTTTAVDLEETVKFEKGGAVVSITLVKQNDKWAIDAFNCVPQ